MALSQAPALVSIPHQLVADERALCYAAFEPRETLRAYIERTGIVIARGPVAVWHNGYRVPDELWDRLIPRKGDQIIIRGRAEGGGGGNKILRTVALVVVAIAAAYTGGLASSAYAGTAGATAAGASAVGAAVSAAVLIAGTVLVNALIPLPKPNNATTSDSSVDSNPAYQIQASRNTSRVWEPMLLVMGGPIKVVPDVGSNPSTRYVGDDQYLSQIFHFGLQPDMSITDLRIGDSPLSSFQGVQVQTSGWNGALDLAPDNVDTIQGFDLNQVDGWNARTTPVNTNYIEVEVAAILFSLDTTTGDFNDRAVVYQIEYRDINSPTWIPFAYFNDPVYATHYWALGVYQENGNGDNTYLEWQQQSYGSVNIGDHVNGEQYQQCYTWGGGDAGDNISCQTYEWRWLPHPAQLGLPWQGIAPDPLISYTSTEGIRLVNNSNKPLRATSGVAVPVGQYEVRVRKVVGDINTNTDSNVISVTQIRAYQYTPTDYSNQNRLAVRIRATSQLNGPIDELSGLCAAKCNVWNGSAWVYGFTRNPAWWFLWFALGRRADSGDKLYGACIPEAQIDVETIKAWGAYCDAKGWKFDYVLAQKMSAHDVLTMIARAGQASYSWQSGKLGVVWDAANLPIVAMIGPYNIKAGTFQVSYVDGTVDEIIGNFVNKGRDWQADQVRVRVPGAPLLNNPQTFDLEGIVDSSVAGRAVNLLAASQNFHRRRVTWEMDIEGYIATRGDVVQLSHDLTVWGYAGRLTGGSHATSQLFLDRSVPASTAGFLTIRSPWGDTALVGIFGAAAETDTLIFDASMPSDFPLPADRSDVSPLDWAWQYDPLQLPGRRLKIVSVTPTNDDGVRFEAVDDDPGYYNSENNPFAYTPPRDGSLLRGVVLGLSFEEAILDVASDSIQIRIDWVVAGADRVRVDYRINGYAFPSVTTTDKYLTINAHTTAVVTVTVTPLSSVGSGTARSGTYTVIGLFAPLPAVTGLTSVFRDGLTVLKWNAVTDARKPDYEYRRGSTWSDSQTIAVTPDLEALAVGDGTYFVAARFALASNRVIYGPADSLAINGATLVRNVLLTVDEAPSWTGTLDGGAFIFGGELTLAATGDILSAPDVLALDDVLWYGGVPTGGSYTTNAANVVDVGYQAPVRVDFSIDAYALNFAENVLGLADVLAVDDILNSSNQQHYSVQPQIRTANIEGDWSDWANYVPGLKNARYFDVRVLLTTDDPLIVPFVRSFSWTIDVPDLLQQAEEITVPVAGLHVDFPKPFHAKPNIQVTQLDAVNGDRFTLTNVTLTGFDIYFYNGMTPKQAVMNYIAQRY